MIPRLRVTRERISRWFARAGIAIAGVICSAVMAVAQVSQPTPPTTTAPAAQTPGWPVVGNGAPIEDATPRRTGRARGQFTLSFEQASIPSVIQAVVGGMLGRTFVIDPSLNDRSITLRSASPVAPGDVLPLLDQALRLAGAGIVERGDGTVAVLPADRIQGFVAAPTVAGNGSVRLGAIVIVPLQYISAHEMQRVLELIANDRAVVRVDEVREAVILAGDPALVSTLQETIALFDTDWLSAASFDLVPVVHAPPEAIVADVRRVFGGEQGVIGTQVELVPMARLGAVLVITKRPQRLAAARAWITRFDVAPGNDNRSLFYRGIRNLPAADVAQALSGLMSDTGMANSGPAAPAQTAANGPTPSAPAITARLGSVRIQTAPQVNGLLIYATADEYQRLDQVIDRIDTLPDQVMIEATVAEVTLNDQLQYGVQWYLDTRDNATATFAATNDGSIASSFPGFSYRFQGTYVRAVLNALSTVSNVNVVSSPHLMTISGQTARLQVGDEVPIVTQSSAGIDTDNPRIVNSIQYRETGIVLSVTPRAGSDGLVFIELAQEVSDVTGTTTSGIDSPTIQQRRIETRVAVRDGETIALGGLIRTTTSRGRTGVPIISSIPLLGAAFSTRDQRTRRTELLVFLTPRVIHSFDDARRTTDDLRSRLHQLGQSGF